VNTDVCVDKPKIVLYVEDDPVNALLMQAIFEQRPGLRLIVACDGRQALSLATTLQPDLLLLDLRLPDCNGIELLPLLRRRPGYQSLHVIAVTAEPGSGLMDRGFDELWPKPLNVSHTLERLDALLATPMPA